MMMSCALIVNTLIVTWRRAGMPLGRFGSEAAWYFLMQRLVEWKEIKGLYFQAYEAIG